jgi:hypothetical protein
MLPSLAVQAMARLLNERGHFLAYLRYLRSSIIHSSEHRANFWTVHEGGLQWHTTTTS